MNQDYIPYIRSRVGHDKIILNFAGGIVLRDGEVLLQKRTDSLKWGIPGGAVNLGESYQDAAVREVYEETGMKVKIDDLVGVYSNPEYVAVYPSGDEAQTIAVSFYCSIVEEATGDFDKSETIELKFFPLSNLPPLHNKQHEDTLEDVKQGRKGVYR
jgi:ADP-ribose pyrophosphatase YjhB (NUDIX family)